MRIRPPHASALGRFLCGLAILLVSIPAAAQAPESNDARLQGTLLDPSGSPAVGFRAVLVDIVAAVEYLSEPADALGEYELEVVSGTRYRILAVEDPQGDRFPVLSHAPMPVRVPGSYRLPDVTFIRDDDDALAADPAEPVATDDDPFAVPWYRRPGAIVGWVAGGLAVIALAADGGSDDPASPFSVED